MVGQGIPFVPTPAPISLKVTVVGGGLSGLAAAYALRRAGHDVLILEKSDGTARSMQSPGGLRSLPNMTKVLMKWGLEQELSQVAIEHESTNFLCAETGDKLGVVSAHLGSQVRLDTDSHSTSFLFAHGDVHNLLYDIAKREGVTFRFNATVVGVDPESGVVLLENGEAVEADLVVGADGCHSTLRQYIESPEEKMSNKVENMLILSFTGTICPVDMKDDLRILEHQADLNFCFGNGFFVSVHFHSQPEKPKYSVVLHRPYDDDDDDIPDEYMDWGPLTDVADFDFDFDQLAPWLRKLISRADQIWGRVASMKPTPHCFDNSRLVLVGEAVHTMSPGSASTPAMSLEDAQTLGCLFSVITNKNQIHRLLTAFDEIRLPRAAFAHHKDFIHTELAMLPAGPHRDMRDAFLVQSLEERTDDEEMLEFYEEDIRMYAYDPGEETVSWWSQYGSMILDPTERQPLEIRVEVTR